MRFFDRRKSGIDVDVKLNDVLKQIRFVNSDKMNEIIYGLPKKFGKKYCLDVGTGNDDSENYTTIDMDISCKPDIVGDIRCLFAPSDFYREKKTDYPDLEHLQTGMFYYVRLKHVIEHVEWIYHQAMFDWLSNIVSGGGYVEIETPNLRYIIKMYADQIKIHDSGGMPKFPAGEHNDLDNTKPIDFQRWVNFKLFSGCSPGDTHHSCFDIYTLCYYLQQHHFTGIVAYNGSTLRVLAIRESNPETDLDSIVSEYLGE